MESLGLPFSISFESFKCSKHMEYPSDFSFELWVRSVVSHPVVYLGFISKRMHEGNSFIIVKKIHMKNRKIGSFLFSYVEVSWGGVVLSMKFECWWLIVNDFDQLVKFLVILFSILKSKILSHQHHEMFWVRILFNSRINMISHERSHKVCIILFVKRNCL